MKISPHRTMPVMRVTIAATTSSLMERSARRLIAGSFRPTYDDVVRSVLRRNTGVLFLQVLELGHPQTAEETLTCKRRVTEALGQRQSFHLFDRGRLEADRVRIAA